MSFGAATDLYTLCQQGVIWALIEYPGVIGGDPQVLHTGILLFELMELETIEQADSKEVITVVGTSVTEDRAQDAAPATSSTSTE